MKKLITLFISSTLVAPFIFGNNESEPEHKSYDWEENPTLSKVEVLDPKTDFIYLNNFESTEYMAYEEGFVEVGYVHRKIKVLTDKGIEQNNKIYLPQFIETPFNFEKARVINSKGELINLKKEDVKEGVDEQSEREFRYFAIDGIDKGSEIEYIYVYTKNPVLNGSLKDIQRKNEQKRVKFEVICPSHLKIDFKVYNFDVSFDFDTSLIDSKNKNRWSLEIQDLEGLKNERTSAHSAELAYFGFKLSKNIATNKSDLYSYGELSKIVFHNIYESIDKQDEKFMTKLFKKSKIGKIKDQEEQIRAIEDFVKLENNILNAQLPPGVDMEQLWDQKILTTGKAALLMAFFFNQAEINHEIGLTCNRFHFKFDKEFELWKYADDEVFYFPDIDKFTTPSKFERLGKIDWDFINNYGLFIQTVEISGEKFGVGKIRFIPQNKMEDAGDTLMVTLQLDIDNLDEPEIDVYHAIHGYKAQYIQPYYDNIDDEENKKEIDEHFVNFIDDDAEVLEVSLENLGIKYYGLEPVRAHGKIKSEAFFNKARNNYIFKIGDLIGPQAEMYSEDERKLPVEEFFNRHYHRTIKFNIPDGFKIEDFSPLEIHEYYDDAADHRLMEFKSSYEVKGNEVTVTIIEYYKEVHFPVELFEEYRRVINAAADFNKAALLLEKI